MRDSLFFLLVVGLSVLVACGDSSGGDDDTDNPTDGGSGMDSSTPGSPDGSSPVTDGATPTQDGGDPIPCEPPVLPALTTEDLAPGETFNQPLFVTQAPGDDETSYVVQRPGQIVIVRDGSVLSTPFLDGSAWVDSVCDTGECGLLGLAFHPDYATNRRFFVYYTPTGTMRNVVAEFARDSVNPDVADPTEVRRLIEPEDPAENHNGGMLVFGSDGFLYVGIGDGGSGGDPFGPIGNGQNTDTLFGSILRLDVDATATGFAAAGNPFVEGGGLPQIWAYGLRNPWRFSFDRETDDLYIGDVGQMVWEEISFEPAGSPGGTNFGWRGYEGNSVYDSDVADDIDNHIQPLVTVQHGSSSTILRDACSITGGYVYRGAAIPALQGVYLYGDYCSDDVAAFRYCDGAVMGHQRVTDLQAQGNGLASFGEDNAGNLYLVYIGSGEIKRIIAQ